MTANLKRVQVTQIILSDSFVKSDELGFISASGDAIKKQVDAAKKCAEKHGVDLLVS